MSCLALGARVTLRGGRHRDKGFVDPASGPDRGPSDWNDAPAGGTVDAAPVVFGEQGAFLGGATTLEALAMILDPIRRELKPLPLRLM